MYLFDTSSLIYAWDNYPQSAEMFLPFWTWFEQRLRASDFAVPSVARDELKKPSEELKRWLDSLDFEYIPTNERILTCSAEIKERWIGQQEYGAGAGGNDLLNIGAAKIHSCTLIANEARQPKLPDKKSKYKIPALCSMAYVNVPCLSLVELINEMNQ